MADGTHRSSNLFTIQDPAVHLVPMGVSEELGTPFFVGQHVYCKQKRRPSRAASEAKNEKERSTESTGLSSEERFSQSGGWILKTSDGPWFCKETLKARRHTYKKKKKQQTIHTLQWTDLQALLIFFTVQAAEDEMVGWHH